MSGIAFVLVLVSAFTHAYWNFLVKKAGGTQIFICLSKVCEIVLFAVPFFVFSTHNGLTFLRYFHLIFIGAVLVLLNYIFLGQAYQSGNLSLVYPISRAGSLLFLPILAYLFIGECLDGLGIVAIVLIMVGIFVLQLSSLKWSEINCVVSRLNSPANLYALLAAFIVACYTLWDKNALNYLPAFTYFYLYTTISGALYSGFIFTRHSLIVIQREWTRHKYSIVQVGFFNTFTYMLVLLSLQTAKASYVIALRQLSIAFGVLLGWKLLQESLSLSKQVGILLLLIGCGFISLVK